MNEETRIARNEIVRVGRATWELGLNSLKSGNISVLLSENDILISKTGRSLKCTSSEPFGQVSNRF